MASQDRVIQETNDKKNEVESFIYEMRDKLDGALGPFLKEAEKEALQAKLSETESWLYDGDGGDLTKSAYQAKLDELKAAGKAGLARQKTAAERPAAASELLAAVEELKRIAASTEAQYEHLTAEDRVAVVAAAEERGAWLAAQTAAQEKLDATADSALTAEAIREQQAGMERVCRPIVNKPKPKPAAAPAPAAPAADGKAPEAADAGKAPEPAESKAGPTKPMDLD